MIVAGVAGVLSATDTATAKAPAHVAPAVMKAPAVAPAAAKAPAAVPADGMGGDRGGSGRIQIDARVYAAAPGSCITLPPAPGAQGNAVTNGSGVSIAFFGNPGCAGVPVATVGPNGSAFGVNPPGGAGSFRVLNVN